MNVSTLSKSDYRYNILDRLARLTPVNRMKVKQLVKLKSGVSESTLQRVLYQRMEEPRKTNYEVLRSFALVWNCSVEELENEN